ncbi:hypothetical protein PMIN02_005467 [Paraphaeosphaeria minitans]
MPTVDSSYTIKTTYLRACLLNVLRECPRRAADRPHLHHLHHSCPLAAPLFSHWLTRLAPARPSTISSLFQSTPLLIISTEPTATPRAHQLDVHSYAIQNFRRPAPLISPLPAPDLCPLCFGCSALPSSRVHLHASFRDADPIDPLTSSRPQQLSGQLASHHQSTQFLEPTFSVVKVR